MNVSVRMSQSVFLFCLSFLCVSQSEESERRQKRLERTDSACYCVYANNSMQDVERRDTKVYAASVYVHLSVSFVHPLGALVHLLREQEQCVEPELSKLAEEKRKRHIFPPPRHVTHVAACVDARAAVRQERGGR